MGWNVLAQRSTPLRYRLATFLAYMLIVCTSVACFSGGGPPPAGPSSNKCDAPAPPQGNVRAQADNCGVPGLEIVRKDVLPKTPKVGIVTIDLYIEQHDVCAIINVLCLLGDNRPFVLSGQPDPKADYSRNRAHMILDFRTGQLTLIVNPSCRIHPLGVGWDPNKECFTPQNEGSGTDLKLNVASDGTVDIEVTLHQSDYPSGGTCDLYNHFSILPHNDAGTFDLTGEGSGFPDLAVIQGGQVVYADQGTHATELCFSPVLKRHYDYHPAARETPTPTTDLSIDVHCTSTGQLCNPPFEKTVKTGSVLKIEYGVPAHCSSIRLHIFLDAKEVMTTGFLGWPGGPPPLSTGILDLGTIAPGQHVLALQAEGKVGGCNSGQLQAWQGTLRIYTS